MLEICNLSKTFKNSHSETLHVLDHISFSVKQGDIIGILGKSGCGKSTLLRIIAGLLLPDEGDYRVDHREITDFLKDNNIGFVFQRANLFPWLNLIENLLFPVNIIKKAHEQSDIQKAEDLLQKFGILEYKKYYPYQLSGGMLQRASVARAFMCDPKILLLDEPFNAIDEQTRENLWVDLRKFWKSENTTVILVTHSVREAMFFADQVHVLSSKPSTVTGSVEIDLPYKREKELIVDHHFNELEKIIRTLYGKD